MPKFMTIVRGSEKHAEPPPALFAAIDQLMKDAGKRLVGVGGLLSSAKGARARLTKGNVTVTDGPFTEAKEVVGGYAVLEWASRETAIEGALAFMRLHQQHWPGWQGECEVRPIVFLAP